MKRGQVFVRAKRTDGTWGPVDALDLDTESFRVWIIDCLVGAKHVFACADQVVAGDHLELRERSHGYPDARVVTD